MRENNKMKNKNQFVKNDNYIKLENEIQKSELQMHPCDKPYSFSKTLSKKSQRALLDIDNNHNHSWAIEIFNKNQSSLSNIALQYRGNNILYGDLFISAYKFAKSLKQMGFNAGSIIPVCITNIPEFVYLFLAASFIGAKINVVADWFDKTYLTEIFDSTESDTIFVDDISFNNIYSSILQSRIKQIVVFSLTDSLPRDNCGNPINPYADIEKPFHTIENNIESIKNDSKLPMLSNEEFLKLGELYDGKVIENVDLNDPLTITYTSGTTSPGRPKGVIHPNRSYISLARFYDPDVSGMQEMKNMKFLGHIATDTHISLSCGISDTLYCGCTYDCEPFYSKEFFPYSLIINKSNFVTASVGFWVHLSKLLNFDDNWKNTNLPFLMLPTVTGEACSKGEERFLNYTARKHKFGVAKLPFPLAPVTFSIGGGTTEGTGIFVTLFKSLYEKLPQNICKKDGLGLTPLRHSEIAVLDEKLDYCKVGVPGLLVEKSPCEMIGYTDESLNHNIRIVDKYGKCWLSLGTYSFISDKYGRVKMKGRMNDNIALSDGTQIPLYRIEDVILADSKNIMSCSVIRKNEMFICHIELQPISKLKKQEVLSNMCFRLTNDIPTEIATKILIKTHDSSESFPLDPSGKRSISTLRTTPIDKTYLKLDEIERLFHLNNKRKTRSK